MQFETGLVRVLSCFSSTQLSPSSADLMRHPAHKRTLVTTSCWCSGGRGGLVGAELKHVIALRSSEGLVGAIIEHALIQWS
jgi:hypothetical protein